MPPDPADETGRIARLLSDMSIGGWEAMTWQQKYVDTDPQRARDKACGEKDGAACAIAAWGYLERNLEIIAKKRGRAGCELGNDDACLFLIYSYETMRHYWDAKNHMADLAPGGEDPRKYAERRSPELCDKGIGAACYLAGQLTDIPEPHDPSQSYPTTLKGYQYYARACALGSPGGCKLAHYYLKWSKDVPEPAIAESRLERWMDRLCARRAGACPSLAKIFMPQDGSPQKPEFARHLHEQGCSHKTDPTWEEQTCAP